MPFDDSIRSAHHKLQQQLEENAAARRKNNRARKTLEEDIGTFGAVTCDIQEALFRMSDEHDELWQKNLTNQLQNLHYAQHEVLDAAYKQQEKLEERERDLLREEDAHLRAFEQVKIKAQLEQDREKRQYY